MPMRTMICLLATLHVSVALALDLTFQTQSLDGGASVHAIGQEHLVFRPRDSSARVAHPNGEITQVEGPLVMPYRFPLAALGQDIFYPAAGAYEGNPGNILVRIDAAGAWSAWKGVSAEDPALLHVYPLRDGLATVTLYLRDLRSIGIQEKRPPRDAILEIYDRSLKLRHTLRLPSSDDVWYHVSGSVDRVFGARYQADRDKAPWVLFRADGGRVVREEDIHHAGIRAVVPAHAGVYTVEVRRGEGLSLARYDPELRFQWRSPISPNRGHTLAPLLLFGEQRIVYVGALDNKLFVSVFDRQGRKLDELQDDKTGQPFSFSGYAGTLEGQRLRLVGLHIEEAPSPKDEKTRLMFFEAAIP